ncbi:MAG: hypothetical protein K8T10_00125 [Candidatus Eremiobacteraeota bacterium]|nr:hypothetical protein [Candidatus Eremiobacteraeota bacterium]
MKPITFKDIFSVDPVKSSLFLVEGSAGTLKSALCFSLMLDILKDKENFGLYLTFEQPWQSHLNNMKSLGLANPENLLVSDYNIMRKAMPDEETCVNMFDSILEMLKSIKSEKKEKFRIFTLDSLNAIYSITDTEYLKSSILSFFRKLKELDIISLVIFERASENIEGEFRERFLADGIISLGIIRSRGNVVRYLQPIKYAWSSHSLKKRQLVASDEGLSILGAVYR